MHVDVAVIGAGAAGIAAAVAAAKAGAEVVLVERHDLTGGLATSAWVGTICGLFYRHPTIARYAVAGFAREFAEAIQQQSRTQVAMYAEGLHFLPYQPAVFHQEALRQLRQAKVRLCLQTQVIGAQVAGRQLAALTVQDHAKTLTVFPAAVVDCSGNAQISALAGIGRMTESHYQAGALVFQVSGLPTLSENVLALVLIRSLKRGIAAGQLDSACERLSLIPGTLQQGVALLKLGLPGLYDGTPACLHDYGQEARSRSHAIVAYLHQHEAVFAALKITAMANEVGIRTAERSEGIGVLDEHQVLACAKPDDGVAIGTWPIEYWGGQRKPDMRYFQLDGAYWISAATLVSRHLDNLFFAGRCLSATELAIASARVIGTCLSTGYAAGRLAADYAETGQWHSTIGKIRRQPIFAGDD
ncbi:MAG: FAD-dependent oxidoreductase [Methylococcaceae bacterium]|nr:FAD-dependent oxidoreductase [Methylococcaceae bacterium]